MRDDSSYENRKIMLTHTRRRLFTRAASLAAASAGAAAARTVARHHWDDFRLAVATFSLRKFSRSQAIDIVRELGVKYVHVKSFHLPYYSSKAELTAARREFEHAGLHVVAVGNISMRTNDEDYIRRHLEYAKNAGVDTAVCAPLPENLRLIEKHAKRVGLKIAVHNHGPEDDYFPNAAVVLKHIRNMDPCMGLCYDVGHAARTGVDVTEEIEAAGDRLFEVHIKDLTDFTDRSSQVEVGKGKIPVAAIFRSLRAIEYTGVVGLEYERNPNAPQQGMAESLAYMRGVLDGQADS